MNRLLCLVSAMDAGGAETFLMKLYRNLDTAQYQMDFCVNKQEEGLYDAEILKRGGKIYRIPSKSENFRQFSKQLSAIVRENQYRNVMRITSNGMGFYDLYLAKKAGAKNCIARSSNSSDGGSLKSKIVHRIGKLLFQKYVDVEIAPSDLAAIYTFGKKDYQSGKVQILHNGIDPNEYRFSEKDRIRVRSEMGIAENDFVIGHIGRFSTQKNHEFLVNLFSEIHRKHPETVLFLIGTGELEETIRKKIQNLNLESFVIFAGIQKNIPAMLSAMDVFAFPSLYEGMPNVLIEAQASGLKCFVSDAITSQVAFSSKVVQLPIRSVQDWVTRLEETIKQNNNKQEVMEKRKEQLLPPEYNIGKVVDSFVSYLI